MSVNNAYIEEVDRYLRGDMSREERAEFEAQIEKNPELKELHEFTRDTQAALEINELGALKQQLQQTEDRLRKKNNRYPWVKIAASLLIVITLGFVIYQFSKPNYDQLYDEYYRPYPNIVSPTNRSSEQNSLDAYQLLERGETDKALTKLYATSVANDTVTFYLGQALLAKGKYEEAIAKFKSIAPQSTFFEPAQWYESLAYLQTDDQEKLLLKLDQIINSQSSYAQRAKKIKEGL
ncbi:hypothetical protein E1176_16675 [Fulvivirga sp. RKSG066]|uniref:hypothetical protein n=1 Tax=Fulvivirga aurantia TaxID=2529383 RepID=UPI0012BD2DDF|nr:hypothetical protein [Fulvivirga aurantia]MTI22669.1 hypothetical protein [Fulvivirga aurantia]